MDPADICLKGLRSYIRDKLEGLNFLLVAQVQVRDLIVENLMNKEKYSFKSCRSNVHLIDYDSDSSSDSDKEVYATEFPLKKILILDYHISRLIKVGKKKLNILLMFLSVIVSLMNCLNHETLN
jgi:hypothetical protein